MKRLLRVPRFTRFTAAALAVAALPVIVHAATLRVPEQYATIQAAVDAAAAGDSVLVGPGTWTGEARSLQVCGNFLTKWSVIFLKPGLTIIGTAGSAATVLNGGPEVVAAVETVLLSNADGPPTELRGFTITGGGEGVSIGCTDSHVELVECTIVGNVGFGVDASNAYVTLRDCVVSDNEGNGTRAEVVSSQGGELEVFGTRFEGSFNRAINATGSTRVLIEGCEFVECSPKGAVAIISCTDATIRNSLFLRNFTGTSGGGALINVSVATVEFNTFAYDSAASMAGGALNFMDSWGTVRNNTFYSCSAPLGSGLAVQSSTVTCGGNVLAGNSGEALANSLGTILPGSGCNILWANTADYFDWDPAAMATDIYLDPLFCAPDLLDFTVRDTSPALTGACGQVGAFGMGCGVIGVDRASWGQIKGMYRQTENGR